MWFLSYNPYGSRRPWLCQLEGNNFYFSNGSAASSIIADVFNLKQKRELSLIVLIVSFIPYVSSKVFIYPPSVHQLSFNSKFTFANSLIQLNNFHLIQLSSITVFPYDTSAFQWPLPVFTNPVFVPSFASLPFVCRMAIFLAFRLGTLAPSSRCNSGPINR